MVGGSNSYPSGEGLLGVPAPGIGRGVPMSLAFWHLVGGCADGRAGGGGGIGAVASAVEKDTQHEQRARATELLQQQQQQQHGSLRSGVDPYKTKKRAPAYTVAEPSSGSTLPRAMAVKEDGNAAAAAASAASAGGGSGEQRASINKAWELWRKEEAMPPMPVHRKSSRINEFTLLKGKGGGGGGGGGGEGGVVSPSGSFSPLVIVSTEGILEGEGGAGVPAAASGAPERAGGATAAAAPAATAPAAAAAATSAAVATAAAAAAATLNVVPRKAAFAGNKRRENGASGRSTGRSTGQAAALSGPVYASASAAAAAVAAEPPAEEALKPLRVNIKTPGEASPRPAEAVETAGPAEAANISAPADREKLGEGIDDDAGIAALEVRVWHRR
ncbi:unnamed protein product [Pylaiella littoralis]